MAKVVGLGHVGVYCNDLEKMVAFYRDFLGLQVTKQNWQWGMIFLSSDPKRSDHEIALMRAPKPLTERPQIEQISLGVESLADVREFVRRIRAAGLTIRQIVSHCSAIGCYYLDPEGNRSEVFWRTPRDCWVPALEEIDLENMTDEDVMEVVERQYAQWGHVPVGETLEPATAGAR